MAADHPGVPGSGDATQSGPRNNVAGSAGSHAVGPYHLIEKVGEGGFGVVYRAEQREPFRREVALKLIKPGMDSRAVVARFEAERQALAFMDHPGVAKVLDGGTTADGRPYFVMEIVRGDPLTAFCDKNRLSIHQRLTLFIAICEAVQHAHTKGVMHRDLKPSNILVAYDGEGRATPKVIDFGVAKALHRPLTEATLFTERGQMIGTPEYMSPEQAEMSGTDIDTRSDIYSLGVVLYELITGVRPFEPKTLRQAGLAEIVRIISEVEPPKPSTRFASLAASQEADTATKLAEARRADTRSLSRALRDDRLDWVVMKCLEKDRARRYETANALAMELRRFIQGEPVLAGPPSRAYRLRKFLRRNRGGVVAGTLVALALLLGLVGTSVGFLRAEHRRLEALAALDREAAERTRAETALAETEQQRARADERAIAAETAEKAARDAEKERADQLKKVSDFQSQMLAQIDTTQAGIDLMADVRERFASALEQAGVPEAERTARVDALRQELVRVNATDAAAAMIDRTILRPAIKTIDEEFKDDPATDASLRQALADLYRTIGL